MTNSYQHWLLFFIKYSLVYHTCHIRQPRPDYLYKKTWFFSSLKNT